MIDLRLGDWRTALADVGEVDCLMVDAPYSAKTHSGHDAGTAGVQPTAEKRGGYKRNTRDAMDTSYKRRSIDYSAWTVDDVNDFVDYWAPRCRGWMVSITDDVLFPAWRDAMVRHNRQVFQDVVAVVSGMTVRLSGDGPSSWCLHIALSRPRTRKFAKWGTTRGAYVGASEKQASIGGKPEWLMRDLITDYSKPGDLVVDPCSGGGTTLLTAYQTGRRAVGSEIDPATHAKAQARLDRAMAQPHLFDPGLARAVQERLV